MAEVSRNVLRAWAPVAAVCALIFVFSQDSHSYGHSHWLLSRLLGLFALHSPAAQQALEEPFRKLAHVLVYGLLGAVSWRAFALPRGGTFAPAARRALVFGFLYACSDEFHQRFIPTRGPSLHDVALDTLAVGMALAAIGAWQRARWAAMATRPAC